jgi:hypothetical protein
MDGAPTIIAPVVESGSGAGSLPPWAAPTAESEGPPHPVVPRPPEPWDAGVTFRFVGLEHTSKDQKACAKSGKRKKNQQKICGIPLGATKVLAGGMEPPDLVMVAGLLPVTFEFSVRREPPGVRPPSAPRQDHHR